MIHVFFIDQIPVPQSLKKGRYGKMYRPKKYDRWKSFLSMYFKTNLSRFGQYERPVKVNCIFLYAAEGASAKILKEMPDTELFLRVGNGTAIKSWWKPTKPDKDNLEKPVLDAIKNSGFLKDDAQVVAGLTRKFWTVDTTGVYVEIEEL